MGVKLKDLVPRHQTSFKKLSGKRLGVDAFNWLYQFLSIIRQPDGTPLKDSKDRVTSHLTGLFYRTCKMLEHDLMPCYVFDGSPPSFKRVTATRRKRRSRARKEYLEAKARGDEQRAYTKATQSSRLTNEMIVQAKELCSALGVPVIQAPSEGEAQGAFMVRQNHLFAVATQDYDAFLFGSPRVIRNLNVTGRRRRGGRYVTINPELVLLKEVLESNELSQQELIVLGLLMGTDYNPGGVRGIGPKRGLKLVREHGVSAWQQVEHEWTIDVPELIDFFLHPPVVNNYSLEWQRPSAKKVKALLVDEFEFSEERVNSALEKLDVNQQGLNNFL